MNTVQPPDDPALHIERIGPIATPRRVAAACVPILGMTITPLLPFAITPTLWFGVPAVMVWMAGMVVLTVGILQLVDRGILRQAAAHGEDAQRDAGEA
jgi:hypothetical protein